MKKRYILSWLLLLLALLPARAQNNPYEIDDECYRLFNNAELTLGTPEYQGHADSLLRRARAVGDRKAEVLFYVEELKNATRSLASVKEPTQEDNVRVEEARDVLLKVAEKNGYMQYYYYGLELTQNYYFNHGQKTLAMRIAEDAHADATARGDAYGVWSITKYLVALYREREDYLTSRIYIRQALDTYEHTTDKTIRRQSPCRLYCDLSDTYPVGSDSMYLYIRKADETAVTHMDSIRVWFYKAVVGALEGKTADFRVYEGQCLGDRTFFRMNIAHPVFFESVDHLISGDTIDPTQVVETLITSRNVKFLANIAETYGHGALAFELEKQLVTRLENNLSKVGMANLAEMNAHVGNTTLRSNLLEKERDLARTFTLVAILVAVILLGSLIFALARLAMVRKIKERDEEMIARLTEANEAARLANEAKTRFIQNMSHEVRTPLNAIVGFSQLLSLPDGSFSDQEKDEFASHIINNSKMLNMLLDDILNASSMDSGKYKISIEESELHFMCQAAISSAEHRLQPGVTLTYKPENEAPFTFRTDPRRVQQILINFLTNACKHTTQGHITLTSSATATPGYMTFAVEDTGPGVPAGQEEAIFNRFTKLNTFVQGTGLGLSICREISERMGGKVWLDTDYKDGARFVLIVPLVPNAEEN